MIRLIATVLLLWAGLAQAQLAIEITGAGAQRIPIAIVPLAGEKAVPPGISTSTSPSRQWIVHSSST